MSQITSLIVLAITPTDNWSEQTPTPFRPSGIPGWVLSAAALALAIIARALSGATAACARQAPPAVKLGIVSFLTGPAAGPFGIAGRNAAEALIEAFNAGKAQNGPPRDVRSASVP